MKFVSSASLAVVLSLSAPLLSRCVHGNEPSASAGVPPAAEALRGDKIVVADHVITMDGSRRVLSPGAVAVKGEKIVLVGTEDEARAALPGAALLRYPGKAILPGFVNAHTHVPMSLLRGVSDDRDLMDWLNNFIFPAEKKNVTREFSAVGTRLSCLEMLLGGTTTFADMYYFVDAIAEEVDRCGIRAVVGTTFIDFPSPDHPTWDAMVSGGKEFVQRWKSHPRVIPALAPHSPYTVSKEHLQEVAALGRSLQAPILIHVAESPGEMETIQKQHGSSPVAYLESIGFWSDRVTAAHMVHVSDADMGIIASRGVGVAHNPQSNMKLASGVAPVPKYLAAGLRLGLGTDGPASNNDQDMFDEMRSAALLHKVTTRDPKAASAQQVLEMATIGGARALHLEKSIGSLEKGKLADLMVVDMDTPHQAPLYSVVSQLVYATRASDVNTVVVHGRVVVQDKKILTLNSDETLSEARRLGNRIRESLRK